MFVYIFVLYIGVDSTGLTGDFAPVLMKETGQTLPFARGMIFTSQMHHKAFGGRAPPEPAESSKLFNATPDSQSPEGKEGVKRESGKGLEAKGRIPILQTDRHLSMCNM